MTNVHNKPRNASVKYYFLIAWVFSPWVFSYQFSHIFQRKCYLEHFEDVLLLYRMIIEGKQFFIEFKYTMNVAQLQFYAMVGQSLNIQRAVNGFSPWTNWLVSTVIGTLSLNWLSPVIMKASNETKYSRVD